jgi:hypothetical protein
MSEVGRSICLNEYVLFVLALSTCYDITFLCVLFSLLCCTDSSLLCTAVLSFALLCSALLSSALLCCPLLCCPVLCSGTCHSHHSFKDYSNALWAQEITREDAEGGSFRTDTDTGSAHTSAEPFRLPGLEAEAGCGRQQRYEVRYLRDGEVIGRSVELPLGK